MDEYLKTLLTEEEALEGLKKENETIIKNLCIRAKNFCFNTILPEMCKELSFTSNPFELKGHKAEKGIYKRVNGNEEFVRIDESSNGYDEHDFEIKSEYIILNRYHYWISGSIDCDGCYKDHYGSKLLIYIPSKENEYPEGTHLSDLVRMKKKKEWKNQFEKLVTSLKFDGAKITDIKEICDSILEEEKGSR